MLKQKLGYWLESIIITAIFIGIGFLRDDPLSINSPFPWIWFAPLLIAQRHGLWQALLSLSLILIFASHASFSELNDISLQLFILGGFLMTIISSIFHESLAKKTKKNQEITNYLSQRIQSIAYAYECTSIAYQTIAQSYILKPVTIRSSLIELRELIAKNATTHKEYIFERLLNIFAQQCFIEKAGIFYLENQKISSPPLVCIGNMKPLNTKNSLIETCLEQHVLTYVHPKNLNDKESHDILIVAPFINSEKNIYALLIVESMPFLKFTYTNIEILNLFLQYFLDGHAPKDARKFLNKYPECPVEFANELYRLIHLYRHAKQDSALIILTFTENPRQKDYLFRLTQEKRGLDCIWEMKIKQSIIILTIMPLTNHVGIAGYKTRINNLLKNEFDTLLNQTHIQFNAIQISSIKDPIKTIEEIISKC